MRRHISGIVITVLTVTLLALPAAAGPAHPDTSGDIGWSQGIASWFSTFLGTVQEALPWGNEDPDLQRISGENKNSHPTMDPNGMYLTDPVDPDSGSEDPSQTTTD